MNINKTASRVTFALLFLVATLLSSCNDDDSKIGFSLGNENSHFLAKSDTLALSAQTIAIDSVYSRSTYTLLGQLSDPFFGNLRSSYISRMQCAPGFQFPQSPINGQIDSVALELNYSSWVGDSTVWAKAAVYEITQPLPESRFSRDLTPYLQGAKVLGHKVYQAANALGSHKVLIPLDKELGQRFYDASIKNPASFASQRGFEESLLRGLYVQSTTGSGCMLSIFNTSLMVYYTYRYEGPNSQGRDTVMNVPESVRFTNTKQLYMVQQFENSNVDKLLQPNSDYAYIKSPQGVALQLTLSAEDMEKALGESLGKAEQTRIINEARLSLKVNVPSDEVTIFNPPSYVLLVPRDSVATFFQKGYTEATNPDIAFLSSQYSVTTRNYTFTNISHLITRHVMQHSQVENGVLKINKPLEMVVVPVRRETLPGTNNNVTENLMNYIFPSGARIQLDKGTIKMGVISSSYNTYKR